MIPDIKILTEEIQQVSYPTETYKIEHSEQDPPEDRINGNTDDLLALQQAIYLILGTERYEHIIYSWDYGIELIDLIGKPVPYVLAVLPRRITEALTQDDRVEDVIDFEFDVKKSKVHVTFVVKSKLGDIPVSMEVDI
jgi:hypothetical protein